MVQGMSRDTWDEFSKTILVSYFLTYLCGTLHLDPSVSLKRIFAFSVRFAYRQKADQCKFFAVQKFVKGVIELRKNRKFISLRMIKCHPEDHGRETGGKFDRLIVVWSHKKKLLSQFQKEKYSKNIILNRVWTY